VADLSRLRSTFSDVVILYTANQLTGRTHREPVLTDE
jgi:hypothetical protein